MSILYKKDIGISCPVTTLVFINQHRLQLVSSVGDVLDERTLPFMDSAEYGFTKTEVLAPSCRGV